MQIEGRAAFVAGADRGLRLHFSEELRNTGAKIYIPVRHPDAVQPERVMPIALDNADEGSVQAAAETTSDVRGVRGHEKLPMCGQPIVPARGQVEVPTPL
jgi:NAD(P)-dependent dehydrogenase (short-subunit alcohol dehydrogenase family)